MPEQSTPPKNKQIEELIFIKIPHVVAGVLFLVAVAINIINVIARYVFSDPIFWAEEVLSFMIIWSVYIAAGSISYLGTHIAMDLVAAQMTPRYRTFLGLLTVILTVACSAFVVTQTAKILALYVRTGEASMAARVPLAVAHSAILVGFALMGTVALIRARAHLRNDFD